jgi:secretion/DNA translocation related CpaE-like protein
MGDRTAQVLGVVGGSGGVGASCFAAVLALTAGQAVLVDLDPAGGGVDVLLGIEAVPGARWSGLRLAGGHLEPAALVGGLPRAGPCAVLAADTADLDAAAVAQVVAAAAAGGPVILDLPRHDCAPRAAALLAADLVVVLARADVAGVVAAHAAVSVLPELPVGVVVRRGEIAPAEAAALIGAPLLGVLPALAAGRLVLDPDRPPRASARVAEGVLAGVGATASRVAVAP